MKINDRKLLEFISHENTISCIAEEFKIVADSVFQSSPGGMERTDFEANLKEKLKHPLDDEILTKLRELLREVRRDDKNAFYVIDSVNKYLKYC